ncbi:hypothetical protein RhiirA4_427852 [Rhizophagus irregularis]|uniref:Uncharacterized protein n=1 Tax=Rhizophagus irregularis TaxID=588596 RepID=A0A2I1HAH6_9GLOM|nr:hypothetical protein RhiirA4_427852 [Rhizophagus irregularis]
MNHQVFGTVGAKFNESGTLVIVKKELAKHISKLENYKGRVLKIEFTFSEQHKLAIISVYNKSGDRGKDCIETRIDINKEIMRMVKDSKKKNQQIILMGDFNLQYRKYLQQKNSNRTRISEQLKIFDLLEKSELFDVCKEILNIDDLALTKNHVTHITKKLGSRIDYIWVSKKIFDEIVQVYIKEYDNKNDTDHKIVFFKVTRDCLLPLSIYNKKKKKKLDKRTKYYYDNIDEETKESIKIKAEYELNERKNKTSMTMMTLHEKIQLYEDVINVTKNSEIEKREIYLTDEKEDTSIKDLDLYRAIRFFVYLRKNFKKKKGIERIKRHWKKNISHVNKILKKWDVDGFYYLRLYNFGKVQVKKYIAELDELYNIFQSKLQIKVSAMKEDKIKQAIEQRQKDLEENQKRMIDNVMDREFRKINIDRVLSTNSKENNFDLKTDDTIIERFKVEGGPTTVRSMISKDTYANNFKFLQNNNIRYIDQIISLSKRYLLTIKELEDRKYIKLNLKGKLSANINNYEQIRRELTISPHTYKLKEHIVKQIDGVDKVENLRGVEIIPVIANTRKDVPIIIEFNIGGNLQALFGRTRKVLPGGLLIAMHMIPITTIEDKDLILEKCQGCNITTWLDIPEAMFSSQERCRIPCIIMTDVKNASTFSRNKWQRGINQYNILGQEKIIFPGMSGQIIQENFIYDRILKQQPYLYKSTYSKIHELMLKSKNSFLDSVLGQFLKTGNYQPMTNRMQLCKNRLTTAKGGKLKIYIDGSVKFNRTENIEAIFGLMIYDEDNKLLDTIMSTVEDWITVNKTEALAFLASLLITPKNKEVTIYTDSQTNYDNFMAIKQRPHRNNLRDILKFGSSNYIWAIIKEIISHQELDVKVVKIKAHAEDVLHNILDKEIKERYADIQGVNKLEVIPTCAEYRYVLRWNETIIETNIRRFIRLITRTKGLEKFLNLNRNDKYRMLEIDWHVTFEYLNVNEEFETYFKTNAHSSKQKRMKVQRLIEEMPTIEQMKKSSYDLYYDLPCPCCNKKEETFDHVWTCRYNRKYMKNLIIETIDKRVSKEKLAQTIGIEILNFIFTKVNSETRDFIF